MISDMGCAGNSGSRESSRKRGERSLEQLKKDGIPYITATHDINNPRSGRVMKRLGMKYQYSYEEQWQPKKPNGRIPNVSAEPGRG